MSVYTISKPLPYVNIAHKVLEYLEENTALSIRCAFLKLYRVYQMEDGQFKKNYFYLAKVLGYSRRHTIRIIQRLENEGFLLVTRTTDSHRNHLTNQYELTFPSELEKIIKLSKPRKSYSDNRSSSKGASIIINNNKCMSNDPVDKIVIVNCLRQEEKDTETQISEFLNQTPNISNPHQLKNELLFEVQRLIRLGRSQEHALNIVRKAIRRNSWSTPWSMRVREEIPIQTITRAPDKPEYYTAQPHIPINRMSAISHLSNIKSMMGFGSGSG